MLEEDHERDYQTCAIAHAAWNAERKKIEADKKFTFDRRKQALLGLGSEPDRPMHTFLTAPDPTVEGLAKACVNAPVSARRYEGRTYGYKPGSAPISICERERNARLG